ncbi:DUF3618 domain-containing protein [uncultured Gordonia sp.]|uniref:DUF3618 domain-containing protein n=1 Tax=uncultured Gordonia sp. TaxID=198437 RepID=UPI00258BDFF6|nr:DUF3618 domain-containing protein [uncultured Gordonia sp.]
MTDPDPINDPSNVEVRQVSSPDTPIEQQRAELAGTVDALSDRLDVGARVSAATDRATHAAVDTARDNRTALLGGVGAMVLCAVAVIVVRRRRAVHT